MDNIIDTYLNELIAINRCEIHKEIVKEMADLKKDNEEIWRTWNSMISDATDDTIVKFELKTG